MRPVGSASAVNLERAIALAQKLKLRLLLALCEMAVKGMAQQWNQRLLLASREMMVAGLEDTVLVARTI
jgi:cell division protein FtsL